MRDATHKEFDERWAMFVKNNPTKWKKELNPVLDSQIIMANRFYARLAEKPGGAEKIKRIFSEKKGNR
ncbi:MAG: hypothetical protein CVU81_02300 [Euryarchaeota archaeon HGW-Euryarchaeota-1]|nr:MAG: hypothetical protein CVU81_02300 [Euryarchaeota archaeon HGW-Euryarchaeota-1]